MASSLIMTSAPDSTPLRNFAAVLPSTTAPLKGLRLWLDLLERNGGVRVMSRAGRRREYATARVVGPAANPDFPVRARRRLLERNKFGAADDPTLPSHCNLVVRLAVIVATTPFAGRISIAATTDPGIMGKRLRGLGDYPNENDPQQPDPVRMGCVFLHRMPPRLRREAAASHPTLCEVACDRLLGIAAASLELRHL